MGLLVGDARRFGRIGRVCHLRKLGWGWDCGIAARRWVGSHRRCMREVAIEVGERWVVWRGRRRCGVSFSKIFLEFLKFDGISMRFSGFSMQDILVYLGIVDAWS